MSVDAKKYFARHLLSLITHYNHEKYWRMRKVVLNTNDKHPRLLKLYYLLRIKKMDFYHNASM